MKMQRRHRLNGNELARRGPWKFTLWTVELALAIGLASCGGDISPSAPPASPPPGVDADDPVYQRIKALGFNDEVIEDRGDHYAVEGDIVFDKVRGRKTAIRDLLQAWTTTRVGETEIINVAIDPGLPTTGVDNWRPAIAQAVADWSDILGSSVRFQITADNPDILIRSDNGELDDSFIADAQFPSADGKTGARIRINLDFNSNMTASAGQMRLNVAHELGHCLGLRHTNWQARGESTATTVAGTPNGDATSVMNGGTALNSWNGFSVNDVLAARTLFPESMAVASWDVGRLDLFTLGADRGVRHSYFDGTWHWENLGNGFAAGQGFTGSLTAVSWGPNRIDVFGVGEDGNVKQLFWNGSFWQWATIDGIPPLKGQLTAASWGVGRIDIFGLGQDGDVKQVGYQDGFGWFAVSLGNGFAAGQGFEGQLTATSWGVGRIDVFGLGQDGNVKQLWFDGTWHWSDLGNGFGASGFAGQLAVTTWGTNRLDVFGVGVDGNVKQLWYNGGWNWSSLGNGFASGSMFAGPIGAVSWGVDRIDIFGLRGGDRGGDLLQLFIGGSWTWANIGNSW